MDDIFINEEVAPETVEEEPVKEKKTRKPRKPLSDERKLQLREQLKKAREKSNEKRKQKSEAKKKAAKSAVDNVEIEFKKRDEKYQWDSMKSELAELKEELKRFAMRDIEEAKKREEAKQKKEEPETVNKPETVTKPKPNPESHQLFTDSLDDINEDFDIKPSNIKTIKQEQPEQKTIPNIPITPPNNNIIVNRNYRGYSRFRRNLRQ